MQFLKLFVYTLLSFNILIGCASAQIKDNRKNTGKINETPNKIRERKPPQFEGSEKVKTIAEGVDSTVTTPFAFVARTPESFGQLKKLVKNLPPVKIDFNKTAIVAAFAGEKNTGGYSVNFREDNGKISVNVAPPPKDAFVTQALTSPYAVALVAVEHGAGLNLDLARDFLGAMKKYGVTSGRFEISGGIVNRQKKFDAEGTIGVLNFGKYFTAMFDLTGKAGERGRKLNETISGMLIDKKLFFPRLEAGDFIDRPHRFLTAEGTFSKNKLALEFKSGEPDYVISDAFGGGGKIEAAEIN